MMNTFYVIVDDAQNRVSNIKKKKKKLKDIPLQKKKKKRKILIQEEFEVDLLDRKP